MMVCHSAWDGTVNKLDNDVNPIRDFEIVTIRGIHFYNLYRYVYSVFCVYLSLYFTKDVRLDVYFIKVSNSVRNDQNFETIETFENFKSSNRVRGARYKFEAIHCVESNTHIDLQTEDWQVESKLNTVRLVLLMFVQL